MKKKAICTMIVFILIVTPCHRAYADAGSITVAGGTIATGGLTGAALAGLSGPAVVAVFCAMMAVGVNIELTKQSQQAGMTKTQYLKTKVQQYCQEAGKTVDVFYKGILSGTSVLQNGAIAFNDQASLQIKQFINWLFDSGSVNDNTPVVNDTATMDGFTFKYVSSGVYNSNEFTYNNRTAKLIVENSNNGGTTYTAPFYLAYVKFSSGSISELALSSTRDYVFFRSENTGMSGTRGSMAKGTNVYYESVGVSQNLINAGLLTVPLIETDKRDMSTFVNSLSGDFQMTNEPTADGFTGDRDDWNQRSGVFDPTQGWPTVVNPGLVGQIPIPADTDVTVNIREYLEALQKVLDKLQDIAIVATDKSDGIPKDYDIPDTAEANPTIGKQPPPPSDESTPVTSDDSPNPSTDPTAAAEPLKFDLRSIFPFCIPFDIKDMLSMLSAEPVAPYYEIDWNIPLINQHLQFTVDLTPWNNVALICRRMELLAFVIGLAVVTRNLIRG